MIKLIKFQANQTYNKRSLSQLNHHQMNQKSLKAY
jgi:hypothetical protein